MVAKSGKVETLADRFKKALELRGVSGQSLEYGPHETGTEKLPRGYASAIATGRRKNLGVEMIERAARLLNVEPAWLAFGRGPMERVNGAEFPRALDFNDDAQYAALVRGFAQRMRIPAEVAERAIQLAARDGKTAPEQIPGLLVGLSHLKEDAGTPQHPLLEAARPTFQKRNKGD